MSFAVLRMQKIKNIGSLGKHIDRAYLGKEAVPGNAEEKYTRDNIHWDKNGISYTQKEWTDKIIENSLANRINDEINSRYKVDKKIRKDAVKAIEYIMTSDNLKMNQIMKNERLYTSWIRDNKRFLEKVYGKENVISMHLHLDERTPHIHAIVVPITEDGRLSCKSFINGKRDLSKQQTLYAEMMANYGMARGEFGSLAKHQKPNNKITLKSNDYTRS